jgi:ABC-type polysaccharide/polyol phosphate export permease
VLYPLPDDGSVLMRTLTTLNPMVPIISAYRRIVIEGGLPEAGPFAAAMAAAAGLVVTGWTAYGRLEGRFAERV